MEVMDRTKEAIMKKIIDSDMCTEHEEIRKV